MTEFDNQELNIENEPLSEGFDIDAGRRRAKKKVIIAVVAIIAAIVIGLVLFFIFGKKEPKVNLGQYKGLTYKTIDIAVTDAEVEQDIQYSIKAETTYKKLDDRLGTETVVGDIVNCSYKAMYDGKVLQEATGNFTIGSNEFKEFEDAITGKIIGDTITVIAEIPEDYSADPTLPAGEEVTFDVVLNFVSAKIVPELNDEFAKKVTAGKCSTVVEYREYIKSELEEDKKEEAEAEIVKELTNKIIKNSQFENIDGQVDEYYNTMYATYEAGAEHFGISMPEYTERFHHLQLDEFQKKIRETMIDLVKEQLVYREIADKEKLKISDEKYKEYMSQYLKEYGYDDEKAFVEYYGKESIEESMLYDYAIEFVINNAKAE